MKVMVVFWGLVPCKGCPLFTVLINLIKPPMYNRSSVTECLLWNTWVVVKTGCKVALVVLVKSVRSGKVTPDNKLAKCQGETAGFWCVPDYVYYPPDSLLCLESICGNCPTILSADFLPNKSPETCFNLVIDLNQIAVLWLTKFLRISESKFTGVSVGLVKGLHCIWLLSYRQTANLSEIEFGLGSKFI